MSLLLSVVIVALAVRLWQVSTELNDLKPEVDRLRNEVGHLDIGDPDDFHVIQVPTGDAYHWRWRIRLPDGVEARLICLAGEIPASGFGAEDWMTSNIMLGSMSEREFFVDITVGKNYRDLYAISASYNNQTYTLIEFDDGPPPWLEGLQQYRTTVTGDGATEVFERDVRVPLIRLRSTPDPGETHGEGILAWLTIWGMHDTPWKAAADETR